MREYPREVLNASNRALSDIQAKHRSNFPAGWYTDLVTKFMDYEDGQYDIGEVIKAYKAYGVKDDRNKKLSARLLALDPGPSITGKVFSSFVVYWAHRNLLVP